MSFFPLLLGEVLVGLGFGQQVVLAALSMTAIWWVYRGIGVGKLIGGMVSEWVLRGLLVGAGFAFAIGFGWLDVAAASGDIGALLSQTGAFVGRFGDDAWRWLVGVLGA